MNTKQETDLVYRPKLKAWVYKGTTINALTHHRDGSPKDIYTGTVLPKQANPTQPTPGPWQAVESGGELLIEQSPGSSGMQNNVCILGNDCEATRADARLIAAAPDLLAACKAWEYAGREGGISMVDWFEVAKQKTLAAIAKAERNVQ